MHAVISNLKPQRRAVVAAVIVIAVSCAIVLPRMNARAAVGLNNISVADASAAEGTGATGGKVTFTVSVSGVLVGAASVKYKTVDGTALAGQDYTSATGTLSFALNAQTKTVEVSLLPDATPEPNETFTLELSDATNASIADGTATGTIQNDDVEFSVLDASVTEGSGGGTATASVEVKLSGPSTELTSVRWATAAGTAHPDDDYVEAAGSLTFAAGQTTRTISISVESDTLDEDDEAFTVTLSNAVRATIDRGTAVVTIVDDDISLPPPVISIASPAQPFPEGNTGADTNGTFTLTLSPASGRTISVTAATSDGTATAGSDYAARQSIVTFEPGQTSAAFSVPIKPDTVDEANETFTVTLSNPVSATLSPSATTATGTIADDDDPSVISVSSPTVVEGGKATFNVTLSKTSPQTVTVHVQTLDGTATAPADYAAKADTTLTFAPNETTKPVEVQTAADTLDEANETFKLKASNPTNAIIAANDSGTATITDDDAASGLSIADASGSEGNTGSTPFAFVVTLSAVSGQAVTVHYATADGTATTADSDYAAASGDLTFAIGETTKTITVNVSGDTKAENTETFTVQLSNPIGAALVRNTATGTITNEDGTPPPPAMQITTGAGAGAGSHVRVLDRSGAPQPPDNFFPYADGPGVRVARGDLDGDGHDEIVVASGPGKPPLIRVFTPAGASIADTLAYADAFTGGVFVAVGDVDGDGKNEVITAAGAGGGPHVRSFSLTGAVGSRSLVASDGFFAADPSFTGGLTVAAGDTNGDGRDEIVVGHASNDQPVVSVWNYNPTTKAAARAANDFLAYGSQFLGGVSVAVGDLDGDNKAEIVTGAGPGGGPHVRVFAGDGSGLPGSAYAYPSDFAGGVNVAVGDVDGDGTNEIITGAGPGGGPHVRTFDILMRGLSTSFYAYGPNFPGGVYVAAGHP